MADATRDAHVWFLSALDAHVLGLLDEGEERRFLEHAEACAECAEAMRAHHAISSPPMDSPGHVPAAVIARWDRARHELRGLARAMVREHLASCAECRRDLVALGFTPEIEEEPAPEPPAARPKKRIVRISPWWAVASAGLAAAASWIVAPMVLPGRGPAPSPQPPSPPAEVRAAPQALLEILADPIRFVDLGRGASDVVPARRVEARQRFVAIQIPDLFLSESTTVVIEIVGPDGKPLATRRASYGSLLPGRALLTGTPGDTLALGAYTVRVTTPHAAREAPATWRFVLER